MGILILYEEYDEIIVTVNTYCSFTQKGFAFLSSTASRDFRAKNGMYRYRVKGPT